MKFGFRLKMPQPSKFKRYRQSLKEKDPAKYEEYLRKARERAQRNRDKRKEKWATEPQTRSLLQEIESFKDKERCPFLVIFTSEIFH